MVSTECASSIREFTIKDAKGNGVDLGTYKGKVLQIVNVASRCELTNSNYMELSQLYEEVQGQRLEGQEPGSNGEIVEFACSHFKAEYPIFEVDVNGDNAVPIYKFLRSNKGGILGDSIKWKSS